MEKKASFVKEHADAIAIIGVNIALSAIMISLWVSNTHRIDATNARMDGLFNQIIELVKNQSHPNFSHSKGFRPYEDRVPIPVEDWMIKDPSVKKGE